MLRNYLPIFVYATGAYNSLLAGPMLLIVNEKRNISRRNQPLFFVSNYLRNLIYNKVRFATKVTVILPDMAVLRFEARERTGFKARRSRGLALDFGSWGVAPGAWEGGFLLQKRDYCLLG